MTFNRLALLSVIVLMCISVGLSAKAAHDVGDVTECNQDLLQQTVVALNQRTVYSDRTASAQQRVRDALGEVVSASLAKQQPSGAEARRIVAELGDALKHARKLTKKAQQQRDTYEYPTAEQIRQCPS